AASACSTAAAWAAISRRTTAATRPSHTNALSAGTRPAQTTTSGRGLSRMACTRRAGPRCGMRPSGTSRSGTAAAACDAGDGERASYLYFEPAPTVRVGTGGGDLEEVAGTDGLAKAHGRQGLHREPQLPERMTHDQERGDAGKDGLAVEMAGKHSAGALHAHARAPAGRVHRLLHDGQAVEDRRRHWCVRLGPDTPK